MKRDKYLFIATDLKQTTDFIAMKIDELKIAVERSRALLQEIKKKYPGVSGDLIFSSSLGQCRLTTDMTEILNTFPQMIVDGRQKQKILQLAQDLNQMEFINKNNAEKELFFEKFKSQLSEHVNKLEIKEEIFVEVQCNNCGADPISKLHKDELMSQKNKYEGKTPARLVLGTLGELTL